MVFKETYIADREHVLCVMILVLLIARYSKWSGSISSDRRNKD